MIARLLLAAGTALVAASATAGGLASSSVAPAVSVAAPPADWSGFYAGAQIGWGNLVRDDFDEFGGTLAGVHAGYQHDFGRIVLGGEFDWDASDITVHEARVDSILRAKIRLGYDAGRVQPYLTAGWTRSYMSSDDFGVDATVDDGDEGLSRGFGISFAVTERYVASGEILTTRFGNSLLGQFGPPGSGPFERIHADVTTISLRASMRF